MRDEKVSSAMLIEVIKRKYSVCGREITVKVYESGRYEGAHYFRSLKDGLMELDLYSPKYPDEEYGY